MRTVYFHNPTELDIRGACIMGLSAKDDEDSAIGKFGTGLKYAIASILRWGGAVEIKTAGRKYSFSKQQLLFRGKQHDQVFMHSSDGSSKELGFTTHYGSHWEPWQIFRELYANALDEGGGVSNSMGRPTDSGTVITVHCTKLAECYGERDTIILPHPGLELDSSGYKTHVGLYPSSYLYYRNVRVSKQKCLFTWNLFDCIELTEDRSITNNWGFCDAIGEAVQQSDNYDFISKCLRASDAYLEAEANYASWRDTSPTFLRAAEALYKEKGKKALPSGVWQILVKQQPALDDPADVTLTKVQQAQLDRAVELVARMGYPVADYPIRVVDFQKNTLGMAKNGTVFLSPAVFEQGTKQVVSTLLEEVLHLSTGLKDCTYEMQTALFNKIVSLYEEHVFQEAC